MKMTTNVGKRSVSMNDIEGDSILGLAGAYQPLIQAMTDDPNKKTSKSKESLALLDKFRYEELPSILASRSAEKQSYLNLNELKRLLEWKMSRGVFRPALRGLIASNDENAVKVTTTEAFAILQDSSSHYKVMTDVMKAMKTLCQLRGVGPATASLLLSVAFPIDVPFFGDELYAWVSAPGQSKLNELIGKIRSSTSGTSGLRVDKAANIKYTNAEYKTIYGAVIHLRRRCGAEGANVSAADIEKAAFVIIQSRSGSFSTDDELSVPRDLQQETDEMSPQENTRQKRKISSTDIGKVSSATNSHLQADTNMKNSRRSGRLATIDASEPTIATANKRKKTR